MLSFLLFAHFFCLTTQHYAMNDTPKPITRQITTLSQAVLNEFHFLSANAATTKFSEEGLKALKESSYASSISSATQSPSHQTPDLGNNAGIVSPHAHSQYTSDGERTPSPQSPQKFTAQSTLSSSQLNDIPPLIPDQQPELQPSASASSLTSSNSSVDNGCCLGLCILKALREKKKTAKK